MAELKTIKVNNKTYLLTERKEKELLKSTNVAKSFTDDLEAFKTKWLEEQKIKSEEDKKARSLKTDFDADLTGDEIQDAEDIIKSINSHFLSTMLKIKVDYLNQINHPLQKTKGNKDKKIHTAEDFDALNLNIKSAVIDGTLFNFTSSAISKHSLVKAYNSKKTISSITVENK
jgi:hypothetical protein